MSIFNNNKNPNPDRKKESLVLKIVIDDDMKMKVESVFDEIDFEDVKNIILGNCARFLNETYGVSDLKGNGVRELISVLTAAMIGSFKDENERNSLMENIKHNSETFAKVFKEKEFK